MSKKLWGGRFTKDVDKDFFEFQKSIGFDYKLAKYDIYHSKIHVEALQKAKILSKKESKGLTNALDEVNNEIKKEIEVGKFNPQESEDIHTEIQNRVEKKVKKLALKLHTVRSRNDQIVFDEKFYCVEKAVTISKDLFYLIDTLIVSLGIKYKKERFIGYTHTRRAQAIFFGDYLSAYAGAFWKDKDRLDRFHKNLYISIGAGALAASSLVTKQNYNEAIRKLLFVFKNKKVKPTGNPIENVSDRDFIIEFLSILSIIQMHLSRLAEDLILYSTKEFDFIKLPEEFCTGSSFLPHKKNPDSLELIRGYTGRIYGNLISVLTIMKGLPLSYNRDMQLDKEPLFSSVEVVENELKIMARLLQGITLQKETIKKVLKEDITFHATELTEWLVKEQKVPFSKAHNITGRLIILIEKQNGNIKKIDDRELKKLHFSLNKGIISKIMSADHAFTWKKVRFPIK